MDLFSLRLSCVVLLINKSLFSRNGRSTILAVNDNVSLHSQEAFTIKRAAATVHDIQGIAVFLAATIAGLLQLPQ